MFLVEKLDYESLKDLGSFSIHIHSSHLEYQLRYFFNAHLSPWKHLCMPKVLLSKKWSFFFFLGNLPSVKWAKEWQILLDFKRSWPHSFFFFSLILEIICNNKLCETLFHLKLEEEGDSHWNCKKQSAITAKGVIYVIWLPEHKIYLKAVGMRCLALWKRRQVCTKITELPNVSLSFSVV